MSLDQTILYWIQDNLSCGLLDLLMPKLTLLGSGGAIWLLAAGGMLCTKKYRRQGVILLAGLAVGVLVGNVCLKNLIARPPSLLAGRQREAAGIFPYGLFFPFWAYTGVHHRCYGADENEPPLRLGSHSHSGHHRIFPLVPVRPFPQRHFSRCGVGRGHRGGGVLLGVAPE